MVFFLTFANVLTEIGTRRLRHHQLQTYLPVNSAFLTVENMTSPTLVCIWNWVFLFFKRSCLQHKKGEKTQQISNNIETSPPLSLQTWSGAAYCSTSNYIIPSNCVLMVKKKRRTREATTDPTEIPPFCCATFSVCWTHFLEAAHIFFYKVNERGHCSSGCFQWSLTPLQLGIRPACLTEVRRAYLLCVIQNVLGRCRADSGCENSGKSAK